MIHPTSYTLGHVANLQRKLNADRGLIERVIHALGLLEGLATSQLQFVFKGGTSLIVLLAEPRRFSTDIDIVIEKDIALDDYFRKAIAKSPFTHFKEQPRAANKGMKKRHFKFFYNSLLQSRGMYIMLDIVIGNASYPMIVRRDLTNVFVISYDESIYVDMPSVECLLGDKLTAFAPKTIGILFHKDKELEIIKQFYDISVLFHYATDFSIVCRTYHERAAVEKDYRELEISDLDTLKDTFNTTLAIISRGMLGYKDEYNQIKAGIEKISGFIFYERFNVETSVLHGCEVLYLIAHMLNGTKRIEKIENFDNYSTLFISNPAYSKLNYIKKLDIAKFAYLYEAIKLGSDVETIARTRQ